MGLTLDPAAFRHWTRACAEALASARSEIDALNVFPVPDSDTGTNSYLTFVAGAEAVAALEADAPFADVVGAYVDGLLTGAKGNSGVILSQLVRACLDGLSLDGEQSGDDVARALGRAVEAAYAAVGNPVEGTILSVARAAADGASVAAEGGDAARDTFGAAARAAREGLARTPEALQVLASAGVVDAGGLALVVVLDATEQVLTGRRTVRPAVAPPRPRPAAAEPAQVIDGPAFEVMYLVEADELRIAPLRRSLSELGDSVVVVGGGRLWNVHAHVDDVGGAIEAGIVAGRPYRIVVTHFADQAPARPVGHGRAVVAATTGDGLTTLCREAGGVPLPFDRQHPLTVEVVEEALRAVDADEIVVLPNNGRFVGLFEAAARRARDSGVRVAVLPTHAQVQGLAALAVHDPGADFEDDVIAMSSAAAYTRHGAVTIATSSAMTLAGPCRTGDVLGIVGGDFAVIGSDLHGVAFEVVDRLLEPTTELVTLVVGHGADDGLAAAISAHLARERPDVDALVYAGGQENYLLFVAAE